MNTSIKRILVVDDEETVLFILRGALSLLGNGYEVVTCLGGLEAMEKVRVKPFDLVITDLSMPDMGGIELTTAIKDLNPETAVVWITAYGCYNVCTEAVRLGVQGCHDKPLEVHEILDIARQALGTDHRQTAVQAR
jgi:DNA-binding NtrC family response regulator